MYCACGAVAVLIPVFDVVPFTFAVNVADNLSIPGLAWLECYERVATRTQLNVASFDAT